MSQTIDIIPLLPGESPEDAIGRTYQFNMHPERDDWPPPAPAGAFTAWRTIAKERLTALWGWNCEADESGIDTFWLPTFHSHLRFGSDCVTITPRRGVQEGAAPTDRQVLMVFSGLDSVLYDAQSDDAWYRLEPDTMPDQIWG